MKTSLIPASILDFISVACGFVATGLSLTPGLMYLIRNLSGLEFYPLAGFVVAISAAALMVGVLVRTLTLAAMVGLARGRAALEWCAPGECATFATWFGCSWSFPGASGWQAGIRVLGLGIALTGTHGSEGLHG
jgi:hypothetical protein